jgi:hypothetical protein
MVRSLPPRRRAPAEASRRPPPARWARPFLAELAATCNVAAAARKAGVPTTTVYDARRNDATFARKWQAALSEGYDNLELELLHRLRSGELKPPPTRKKAVRTFDNANALRLLAAHREAAAAQRAMRDNDDAEAVLAGLNAKLERMRERALAAKRGEGSADGDGSES